MVVFGVRHLRVYFVPVLLLAVEVLNEISQMLVIRPSLVHIDVAERHVVHLAQRHVLVLLDLVRGNLVHVLPFELRALLLLVREPVLLLLLFRTVQ